MKTIFNKETIKIISNENGGTTEYDYNYFAEGFEEWATNLEIDLADTGDLKQYLEESGYKVEIVEV